MKGPNDISEAGRKRAGIKLVLLIAIKRAFSVYKPKIGKTIYHFHKKLPQVKEYFPH